MKMPCIDIEPSGTDDERRTPFERWRDHMLRKFQRRQKLDLRDNDRRADSARRKRRPGKGKRMIRELRLMIGDVTRLRE